MPTFYFHLRDSYGLIKDPDGSDLLDLEMARGEAFAAVREAVAEALRRGKAVDGRRFEIADEDGRVLAEVGYRDVVGFH